MDDTLERDEILEVLKKVAKIDRRYELFGANRHKYKLNLPIEASFVRKVEQEYGFRLPDDYFRFITEIGDGGAGPDSGGYVVFIPDLEINTQGDNLAEALYMARDAIGAWGICQQDAGREIPEPSETEPNHEASELISWVDIDFEKYRRASDMTSERTNITLPRYLKNLANDAGLNLSQELQARLKEVLHIAE